MGLEDFPIAERPYIHHIDPITPEDILSRNRKVFDLDNLITVSFDTHQLIHYGVQNPNENIPTIRTKNDTCPWK